MAKEVKETKPAVRQRTGTGALAILGCREDLRGLVRRFVVVVPSHVAARVSVACGEFRSKPSWTSTNKRMT